MLVCDDEYIGIQRTNNIYVYIKGIVYH